MATKPTLICYEKVTLYIDYEDTVLRLSDFSIITY